jgi:hypothetical protein
MNKNQRYSQGKLYEFVPNNSIEAKHIIELTDLIKIGISGENLEKLSKELQDHFREIGNDNGKKDS